MPDLVENPRDYPEARALRQTEPYAFQRHRDSMHSSYPRPAQANTNQPNQVNTQTSWGVSTQDYWNSVRDNYLKRRGK